MAEGTRGSSNAPAADTVPESGSSGFETVTWRVVAVVSGGVTIAAVYYVRRWWLGKRRSQKVHPLVDGPCLTNGVAENDKIEEKEDIDWRQASAEGLLEDLEIVRQGEGGPHRPPLLFIHGAFNGAWCWEEYFLPWFAQEGWRCYAVSLPGHGRSKGSYALLTLYKSRRIVNQLLARIRRENPNSPDPVIIGHSMGGAIVHSLIAGSHLIPTEKKHILQRLAEFIIFAALKLWGRRRRDLRRTLRNKKRREREDLGGGEEFGCFEETIPQLSGAAMLCTIPPRGGLLCMALFALRWPLAAAVHILCLNFCPASPREFMVTSYSMECQERDDGRVSRHWSKLIGSESHLLLLEAFLWPGNPVAERKGRPPVLVMGGEEDGLFPVDFTKTHAELFGLEAVIIDGVGHMIMLDTKWMKAAKALQEWLVGLTAKGDEMV